MALVHRPSQIVGKWRGYDILIKSYNPVEDVKVFDRAVESLKIYLAEDIYQDN